MQLYPKSIENGKTVAKKEFDENSKLGFIRFIQVYNVIAILLVILILVFVRGTSVTFDFKVITDILIILAQAVVIWLIARRKLYTRQIVIGIQVAEIAIFTIANLSDGNFDLLDSIITAIPNILIIIYFATSRRAKAVLVQPWSDHTLRETQEEKDKKMWDPKSLEFWLRLLIYFFAFSIAGHWMEMGVQILVVNGLFPGTVASPDSLTWRDNLNPFFIYGIAVAICGLVLYPIYLKLREKLPHLWQALLISFLINTLFCTGAELVLGLLCNGDYHAWDYRNMFMNFMGQICLLYTLCFGVASSIITWFVYPMMERAFSNMNRDVFIVIFIVSLVLFLMIVATYNIDFLNVVTLKDL